MTVALFILGLELLTNALRGIQGNTVPSQLAIAAREMASALLIKSEQHSCRNKFSDFTMGLISELQQCFETEKIGKDEREVIWGTFHKVRCSESFRKLWITFANEILDKNPLPIFYQDISHNIFTEMVKKKFSVLEQIDGDSGSPLNIIEENTLRYVTGYVCKQVIKKIKTVYTYKQGSNDFLCL